MCWKLFWATQINAGFKIAAETPAYKIIARLEKKTEIKPVDNTWPPANGTTAVIVSLLPNYTPDFFRNSNAVRARPVLRGLGKHSWKEAFASRVDILCPFPYSIGT